MKTETFALVMDAIVGKKGQYTPIENCKAEDPMKCPYHGASAIKQYLDSMSKSGIKFAVEKAKDGKYRISAKVKNTEANETEVQNIMAALAAKINGDPSITIEKKTKGDEVDELDLGADLDTKVDDLAGLKEDFSDLNDEITKGDMPDEDTLLGLVEIENAIDNFKDGDDFSSLKDKFAKFKDNYAIDKLKTMGDFNDAAMDAMMVVADVDGDLVDAFDNLPLAINFEEVNQGDWDKAYAEAKNAAENLTLAQGTFASWMGHFKEQDGYAQLTKGYLAILNKDAKKYKEAIEKCNKLVGVINEPGKLTKDTKEKLEKWLSEHGSTFISNMCGGKPTQKKLDTLKGILEEQLGKGDVGFSGDGIIHWKDGSVLDEITEAIKLKKKVKKTEVEKNDPPAEQPTDADVKSGEEIDVSSSDNVLDFEGILPPLEHDESKFPTNITEDELKAAKANGIGAGGGGGLGTKIVTINGTKYIMKSGSGEAREAIENGFNCDMAYRAGGIHAPDAKLYHFGDKVYKLAEFIEGTRLDKIMSGLDEDKKEAVRKELLKGFPLDCLFSNWDVLGTNPSLHFTNVMVDKEGRAWRLDNDGAFAAGGLTGTKKTAKGKLNATTEVEYEKWSNWKDRQWIDDFRTMRVEKMNKGVFDGYSTSDIFRSAGHINLGHAVETLPKGIQDALKKPLFEMKQMTYHAVNLEESGFRNDGFSSMALDIAYEASKRGLREVCKQSISWNDSGFGEYKDSWGNYQKKPFEEKEPEKPENPQETLSHQLPNSAYTGGTIRDIIFKAAKTINNHGGIKLKDKNGNVLGNGTAMGKPDYTPNPNVMSMFHQIDREKLAEVAKTDANAKALLGLYDNIIYSKENGWKKPISEVSNSLDISAKLPDGFESLEEKKIKANVGKAMADFKEKVAKYEKDLLAYNQKKAAHNKVEDEKAQRAGGFAYHNFNDFADSIINEGIDTNGIAGKVKTKGVAPIESSMASQKGSSYATDAVKWKIREMMALGHSLDEIKKMAKDSHFYNSKAYEHVISKHYDGKPEELAAEMASQAMYCGLQMLKLENEMSDQYDKNSGVVFVNRNVDTIPFGVSPEDKSIYKSESKTGYIEPHVDSAADCTQFEKNTWPGKYKQVYAVPFARLVCCANNDKANGGGYSYNGENEYVANLYNLPCWVYHGANGLTWKSAIDKAKENVGMKGFLKRLASRLHLFKTL